MVKVSLDDNNLSKICPLSKGGTGRTGGRISAYVGDESMKIIFDDGCSMLKTDTGQGNNEIINVGYRNEIN